MSDDQRLEVHERFMALSLDEKFAYGMAHPNREFIQELLTAANSDTATAISQGYQEVVVQNNGRHFDTLGAILLTLGPILRAKQGDGFSALAVANFITLLTAYYSMSEIERDDPDAVDDLAKSLGLGTHTPTGRA